MICQSIRKFWWKEKLAATYLIFKLNDIEQLLRAILEDRHCHRNYPNAIFHDSFWFSKWLYVSDTQFYSSCRRLNLTSFRTHICIFFFFKKLYLQAFYVETKDQWRNNHKNHANALLVRLLEFIKGLVYQATVTREDNSEEKKNYVGLTEGTFKTRYYNHICSFRNPKRRNSTELSKYIWHLKDSNVNYSIKWEIIKQCRPYSNKTKRCNLCLYEKFIIVYHPELSSVNSRTELISTCRHKNKNLSSNQ